MVETKGGADHAEKGTQLFDTVREALADIPQKRLAGLVLVTDGQVHDVPAAARELGITAPVHLAMTGDPDGKDRRIVVTQSPTFGLVGKSVDVTFQVDDLGSPAQGVAKVTIRRDGSQIADIDAVIGKPQSVPLDIVHGGQTVFEIEVQKSNQELTLVNNAAVFAVNGVRDRLKVLLISGEPYPGERTWRNLLKSDPSVELIHFTILRPPNKQDATPINELALIAFPVDELFDIKLREFDLIIFDRFQHLGILPDEYFQHIVEYVKEGGAVFELAGPSSAGQFSLYRTPLEQIFAAQPTGEIRTQGFQPQVTPVGLRHPVTADLLPPGQDKPSWGRWFREMPASSARGVTVMSGVDGLPLLILDRVGKGRVAQLFSDQLWMWSKGFEGGGPHAELIRRIGHWLMQEPDLEEEDLRATVIDGRLEIRRQSLTTRTEEVTVTRPDGTTETVKLRDDGRGRATGSIAAAEQGLYKVTDGSAPGLRRLRRAQFQGMVRPARHREPAAAADRRDQGRRAGGQRRRPADLAPRADRRRDGRRRLVRPAPERRLHRDRRHQHAAAARLGRAAAGAGPGAAGLAAREQVASMLGHTRQAAMTNLAGWATVATINLRRPAQRTSHDLCNFESARHRGDAVRDRVLRGLRQLHEAGHGGAAAVRGSVPARHRRHDLLQNAGPGAWPRRVVGSSFNKWRTPARVLRDGERPLLYRRARQHADRRRHRHHANGTPCSSFSWWRWSGARRSAVAHRIHCDRLCRSPSGRPADASGLSSAALLAFASAFGVALRDVIGRGIPSTIPALVVTFSTVVIVMIGAGIMMLLTDEFVMPSPRHALYLLAAGLLVTIGHLRHLHGLPAGRAGRDRAVLLQLRRLGGRRRRCGLPRVAEPDRSSRHCGDHGERTWHRSVRSTDLPHACARRAGIGTEPPAGSLHKRPSGRAGCGATGARPAAPQGGSILSSA